MEYCHYAIIQLFDIFDHPEKNRRMLHYLGHGPRRYHERRVTPSRRGRWEFQTILSGACFMTDQSGIVTKRSPPQLYISAPDFLHGWDGPRGDVSEVAVAHFDHVPDPIRRWVTPTGWVELPLSSEQAGEIASLIASLSRDYLNPDAVSAVRFDHALTTLSLIALSSPLAPTAGPAADLAQRRVLAALNWYTDHLDERPTVVEVAEAIGLSETHLRRTFHQASYPAPLASMKQRQIQRVKELLLGTDWTLEQIAEAAGFSASSDLSRTFKRHEQCSPSQWRRRRHSQALRYD